MIYIPLNVSSTVVLIIRRSNFIIRHLVSSLTKVQRNLQHIVKIPNFVWYNLYSWVWSQNHFIAFLTIVRGPYIGTEREEYIRSAIHLRMLCDEGSGVAEFPARRRCWKLCAIYIEKPRSNVRPYLGCSSRAAVWSEMLGGKCLLFHLHHEKTHHSAIHGFIWNTR